MVSLDAWGENMGRNAEAELEPERMRSPRNAAGSQRTQKGLPKRIASICPECLRRIDATLFEEDGKVYLRKTCPEHGECRDLISSDARLYLKMERWTFEDEGGIRNPHVTEEPACPETCGLCGGHLATACLLNIDITNRCNLSCPWCFANANRSGNLFEATREQIDLMLGSGRGVEPRRNSAVQFTGGEPTIHPDFLWAVKRAKKVGFSFVMAATNGITIAKSREFAERCRAAGLDLLYLQFDGMTDDVYLKTRGRAISHYKFQAIENARAAGIRVGLVPTLIKGVNDHQIGDIVRFGLQNLDVLNAISFQPVSFTGRFSNEELASKRFTLADLAWAVKEQTGYLEPYRDWYPLAFSSPISKLIEKLGRKPTMTISCHGDCGIGAYLISNGKDTVVPVTKFMDMEGLMVDLNEMSKRDISRFEKPIVLAQFRKTLQEHYVGCDPDEGCTFSDFLGALAPTIFRRVASIGKKREWRFLILISMHFQDRYNFNLDRVRRCNVHCAAPDGRIYPFCTFNAGPTYREPVERRFSRPLDDPPRHIG